MQGAYLEQSGNVRVSIALYEVISYFFRLGCLGFGGPLALVATMQRDLVERREWLSENEFQKVFSLVKAMPGPLAFQMAVYLGRARAGCFGGFLAGLCMVLPSFFLMIGLAAVSESVLERPDLRSFLGGLQISALAVVLTSLSGLVRPYKGFGVFWLLAIVAGLATWWTPAYEPVFILGFGIALAVLRRKPKPRMPLAFAWGAVGESSILVFSQWGELVWTCLKAGALVFGSGLAIIPLLEHDFVTRLGWLTHQEFMTALALGQVTPGPVVITVTFIGFKVAGWAGAMAATASVFAASLFHMLTWFPHFVGYLSRQKWIQDFLCGAMAAVVGAIAATVLKLALGLELDWALLTVAGLVFVASGRRWLPAWALIPLGGLVAFGLLSSGI